MKTEIDDSLRGLLTDLAKKNDGQLTPQIVLAEAEKKKSPLHSHFCWDDTEAARAWRLDQASRLIRRVRVTIEISPERTVSVRAFFNVTPEATGRDDDDDSDAPLSVYVPVEVAMRDHQPEILAQALSELRAIKNKYSHLNELAAVWDAVDRAG